MNERELDRALRLKAMLSLEVAGMKRSRGLRSANAIIKEEWNLKGGKAKVLKQFTEIIEEAKHENATRNTGSDRGT